MNAEHAPPMVQCGALSHPASRRLDASGGGAHGHAHPQALITVSNHVAALDDPLVVSALLPPGALGRPRALRWTMCATDRCFRTRAAAAFFRAGKARPARCSLMCCFSAAMPFLRVGDHHLCLRLQA